MHCMSHESHNHPSPIVPYEGAATGVGGNVRDVMCMGAEVIACTDSFRFGEIKRNKTKWIHDGVVVVVKFKCVNMSFIMGFSGLHLSFIMGFTMSFSEFHKATSLLCFGFVFSFIYMSSKCG